MANEINFSATFSLTNGNWKELFNPGRLLVDQDSVGSVSGVVEVPEDSETTIDLSSLTKPGFVILHNLSATRTVTFGPDASGLVAFGDLEPGEYTVFRLVGASPSLVMQSETSPAEVKYVVVED